MSTGTLTAKCTRCDGCGRIADTDAGEPWTAWETLPTQSRAAVIAGFVQPIPCPDCDGAGSVAAAPEKPPRDEHDQPLPTRNEHPVVQELVLADLAERLEVGIRRYGTGLQPHNGRDMLRDAYDEAMDLAVYLRGCLYERDGR